MTRVNSNFGDGYTTLYNYDDRGNILSKKKYAYTEDEIADTVTPTETKTFTYQSEGWKDLLIQVDDKALAYDANGNVLTYGDRTLTWERGRILSQITEGENTYSYTYDDGGIRTSKTINGVTAHYNTEDGIILSQSDGTNTMLFQYDSNGALVGFTYNGTQYYYITNQMSDVCGITDASGNLIATYKYNEWGNLLAVETAETDNAEQLAIAEANPFRYRSYYYDAETGYYYLQSRYYDASICRFINADDLSILFLTGNQSARTNIFTYCYNDPLNFSDSIGYQPKWAQVVNRYAKGTLAYKAFLYATKKGWFSNLFWKAGFFRTSDGIYHTRQDCWQQFFGYNDFYDWAFDLGTSMTRAKFPFSSGNKEYIFWAWKGDYLNLGAGAELGIYSRVVVKGKSTEHWRAETKLALFMTMTLKLQGNVIATYKPKAKQWWITSFNPYHQNVKAGKLSVTFTINFSSNKKLFKDLYSKYGTGKYKSYMWKFDKKNYKATLTFN